MCTWVIDITLDETHIEEVMEMPGYYYSINRTAGLNKNYHF
jgi:hypothetical protein